MTLATVTETTRPRRIRLRRTERVALSLDAVLMAASLAVCGVLLADGGLEAFAGAFIGALAAAKHAPRGGRLQAAYSGGFGGLFAGALFASFFHGAFAAALQMI
jgi:hypothetical protein